MEKLISASSEFQRTLCLNEMTRERLRRLQVVLAGYLKFAFIALYPLALLPIIFVNNNSVSLPLLSFEISRFTALDEGVQLISGLLTHLATA